MTIGSKEYMPVRLDDIVPRCSTGVVVRNDAPSKKPQEPLADANRLTLVP
jgi:hypothetical protein